MSKPHILIVDDVAQNIQVAANVLRNEACRISFAQSGEKALEIISNEKINLILLDVMMPEMDGYEVCERIKSDKKNQAVTIIFLTAKNDIDSITRAFRLGGVDYITKPFNNEELLARVRTHLALSQALEENKLKTQELERTNAVKDKLFSIIAHDLRNPFNGLLVLTDILKYKMERMKIEEIREMIDLIYLSSKDGYELLENLLEWSRAQRDKLDFNPILTDIAKLITGNINLLAPMAISKNVTIKTKLPDELLITADHHMIDSVIRNLITNAIKFTSQEGSVFIEAKRKAKNLEVKVRDTGTGISKADQENLFEPSSRKSKNGTANERGTGLGLLLCKEFIEKHKGTISVESKKGHGSTFIFTIPDKLNAE